MDNLSAQYLIEIPSGVGFNAHTTDNEYTTITITVDAAAALLWVNTEKFMTITRNQQKQPYFTRNCMLLSTGLKMFI